MQVKPVAYMLLINKQGKLLLLPNEMCNFDIIFPVSLTNPITNLLMLLAGLPEEGSRVIVYWPGAEGNKWHHGQVKDVDDHGRSTVAYDDADREVLHFALERFKLEQGASPPGM